MAARWRGRDVALNAGNSDFTTRNTHDEVRLCLFKIVGHKSSRAGAGFGALSGVYENHRPHADMATRGLTGG